MAVSIQNFGAVVPGAEEDVQSSTQCEETGSEGDSVDVAAETVGLWLEENGTL